MLTEQTAKDHIFEGLITQIRGVVAARIVSDAEGQIQEIHVVGLPGRNPKQIVRDVESILYVRGGVRVDHRKISLVQVDESVVHPRPVRVQLLDIDCSSDEQGPKATVTLAMEHQRVQGVGRSRPSQTDPVELLSAYATTHALDQLVGPRGQIRLENVQQQLFGPQEVCLAHLSLTTESQTEALVGISVVRDDKPTTSARAVLDAINRRLQYVLGVSA